MEKNVLKIPRLLDKSLFKLYQELLKENSCQFLREHEMKRGILKIRKIWVKLEEIKKIVRNLKEIYK